ncbi:unnamed protein product [Paramecium sonneborni]|uniref:Uncharacterized protein n=1 Tax=Paramecium sonneborni TaxID=65129 RepID=A0A8S1QMV5_9CILI|nr:unnamed protein product [Paramecium sonneborni]
MQQFDIQVFDHHYLCQYQDHQSIEYHTKDYRSLLRNSFFISRNNQNIHIFRQANSQYYQFSKFHPTKANEITHYQLRKCLIYNQFTNLLIYSSYDRLSVYNPCNYKQQIQMIQDFNIVGLSQCEHLVLMAGLQANILFFSLRNGQSQIQKIVPNQECIINQADFINNKEIIVSDNANQIRIFDADNFEKEKYLINCSHPVNHCEILQNLIIACLDQPIIFAYDRRQIEPSFQLKGHQNNNFVVRFDPQDNQKVATSGEDKKCLIWDLRNYSKPYSEVQAITTPFYNILYNSQGQLICIESDDFIQIVDLQNTKLYQIIDFFGKCHGCTFFQDKMYFNLQSNRQTGLFEYNLINNNKC